MSYFDDNEDGIVYGRRDSSMYAPHDKTCERCGQSGLHWAHDGRAWYLVDAETYDPHVCEESDPADDFEVLP